MRRLPWNRAFAPIPGGNADTRPGVQAADAEVPEVSGSLFTTADLTDAVASFLHDGPGQVTYEGR